jgi:hypothetical protein
MGYLRLNRHRPPKGEVLSGKIIEGTGWVPFTPGGSCLAHLEASTEDQAWANLLIDAAHMPYGDKQGFIRRGYTVECLKK